MKTARPRPRTFGRWSRLAYSDRWIGEYGVKQAADNGHARWSDPSGFQSLDRLRTDLRQIRLFQACSDNRRCERNVREAADAH
jgi:hypothetical protein